MNAHGRTSGTPMQNGFVESLNGRFRDACLSPKRMSYVATIIRRSYLRLHPC
ncbi:integrase core domain-containing protein [Chelatococcus asaccharovorans]